MPIAIVATKNGHSAHSGSRVSMPLAANSVFRTACLSLARRKPRSNWTARYWPTWLCTIKPALRLWLLKHKLPWLPDRFRFCIAANGAQLGSVCIWKSDNMTPPVDDLIVQAEEQFALAADAAALENAKAKFLGKQGALTTMLKGLAKLDPEQK